MKCPDKCPDDEALVCGTDGVEYQNECLLKHASCEKDIEIQIERDGPCNNFETTGDDDEGENSQEDEEILRDSEGK